LEHCVLRLQEVEEGNLRQHARLRRKIPGVRGEEKTLENTFEKA